MRSRTQGRRRAGCGRSGGAKLPIRRLSILLAVGVSALGSLTLGCASGTAQTPGKTPGQWTQAPTVRGAVADASLATKLAAQVQTHCRDATRRALEQGRRSARCDVAEHRVGRAYIRRHRVRFGVVEHRDVDLVAARLRLGEARRCKAWVLRDPGHDVIGTSEAVRAGCIVRPHRSPLEVFAVDADGRRSDPLVLLLPDDDGRVRLEYAEVQRVLRERGLDGLDGYASLELGADGWAGRINLRRLRAFWADWHYVWVTRGRGAPGLFVTRHGDHPRHAEAEALAVEARLARQKEDFVAVSDGQLSPVQFLERHAWSPFRRAVERLILGDETPSSTP